MNPKEQPPAEPKVVRFRREDGCVTGVALWGRKWIHMAIFDTPVRLLKVPLEEQRHITPLDLKVPRAAKRMRAAGKRLGITEGARKFLTEAMEGVTPVTQDAEA